MLFRSRYGFHPSPFGEALFVTTQRGLAGLGWVEASDDVAQARALALADMQRRWLRAKFLQDDITTAPFVARVFQSQHWRADQPLKVVLIGSAFEVSVWEALLTLPLGTATTYADLARQIGIRSGIPETTPAFTVNKACGSGLKALMLGANEIRLGNAEVVVAAGSESMSRVPFLMDNARWGLRMGDQPLVDGMYRDGPSGSSEYFMSYMSPTTCAACNGLRLKPASLAVRVKGVSIADFTQQPLNRALATATAWKLTEREGLIAGRLRRRPGNDSSKSKQFEDGRWRQNYPHRSAKSVRKENRRICQPPATTAQRMN